MMGLEKMTLIDLNMDCLEQICRYLPVEDLLNVADANKQLKKAAELVFFLRLGKSTLMIVGMSSCSRKWSVSKSGIRTAILKRILQILRSFGHLICKIYIYIRNGNVDNIATSRITFGRIIFYIKQYCKIESLTELSVYENPNGVLNGFVEPFPNVHFVGIQSSELENVSLNELFPKMRSLRYCCMKDADFSRLETHFPNLVHVEIIENRGSRSQITVEPIRFFQLNQQLNSLILPTHRNSVILTNIGVILPYLQELRLDEIDRIDYSIKFHSKSVKRLTICYNGSFSGIPFSFDKLEELTLCSNWHCDLRCDRADFYNFINKHPTILKLTVFDKLNLLRLIDMLPLIREVDINGRFSNDEIILFMTRKKSLEVCKFGYYMCDEQRRFVQERLKNEWSFVHTDFRKIFKKIKF